MVYLQVGFGDGRRPLHSLLQDLPAASGKVLHYALETTDAYVTSLN